jgi:hypothetical protein
MTSFPPGEVSACNLERLVQIRDVRCRCKNQRRARLLFKFHLLGALSGPFPKILTTEQVICSLSAADSANGRTPLAHRMRSGDSARKPVCVEMTGHASSTQRTRNQVTCSLNAGLIAIKPWSYQTSSDVSVSFMKQPRLAVTQPSIQGTATSEPRNHRESLQAARWRRNGAGTSKTALLNRGRSNAAVSKGLREKTSVGSAKPLHELRAMKLSHGRIVECWKQHGNRQRDHVTKATTALSKRVG